MTTGWIVLLLFLVVGLAIWIGSRVGRGQPEPVRLPPSAPLTVEAGPEATEALYAIAEGLNAFINASAHPSDVLANEHFQQGAALLESPEWKLETLLGYYTGDSLGIAIMALEALGRRTEDGDVRDRVLDGLNDFSPWNRFFALRLLARKTRPDEALIGRVLTTVDSSWTNPTNARLLAEFINSRVQGGEVLALGPYADKLDAEGADALDQIAGRLPDEHAKTIKAEVQNWRSTRVDDEFLSSIGRLWGRDETLGEETILSHRSLEATVSSAMKGILGEPRRSMLLLGERGVGKTVTARCLARRLAAEGWCVFEAGHADLIAGQSYIGELEQRLRDLLQRLENRRIVWFVPEFHSLALAGRHRYGPLSALDYFMPAIEKGSVIVLGETDPAAFERLVQSKPRVLTALEVCRIEPLPEADTVQLVDRWAEAQAADGGPVIDRETRREAWLLAQQYLGDQAAPGNVLHLLDLTLRRVGSSTAEASAAIGSDELIATLSHLTGLPRAILDEREGLDLAALRDLFERRVMGQSEAVDCLVERVAMIKAGVTDPTRPLGVFLFAGPTGTGKTEIAKALADFLFGSDSRMIRLDMSECQDPESLNRILGEGAGTTEESGGALVDSIRKQPFSVVLLDEFEKAHQNIWDLFLQVFDDGVLTDRRGNTSDFRNAIIIMTSNLGSVIASGTGPGFLDDRGRFSSAAVMRVVEKSFRKEFLNRIDRTVVFQPLVRETMRAILHKELKDAFQRRGLRSRAWAVEWDESAVEFLLNRGFTADLGARPLRRAIERYLLSPLALTIVNHQYPEGDQFLFVREGKDGLAVDFVDPDAPAPDEDEPLESTSGAEDVDDGLLVERVALEPRGRANELTLLQAAYDEIHQILEDTEWHARKQQELSRTHAPDFWHSPDRFAILGRVEYLDRVEAGLRTAGSLLERLRGRAGRPRDRYPRDLVGRLAQQLYLLRAACGGVLESRPHEAFVKVEAWSDTGVPSREADDFARRVGGMYQAWSDRRRMRCETIDETGGDGQSPYHLALAISGYAAHSILEPEAGLHLFELPDGQGRHFRHVAARVRIAPQPQEPPSGPGGLAEQARMAFDGAPATTVAITRRYRDAPSPLVRDSGVGWRSGRLDRVLGGDFDLIARVKSET